MNNHQMGCEVWAGQKEGKKDFSTRFSPDFHPLCTNILVKDCQQCDGCLKKDEYAMQFHSPFEVDGYILHLSWVGAADYDILLPLLYY